MAMKIESPEGAEALTEFVQFYDQVYDYRSVRWSASVETQLPLLTGESADCEDRIFKPLVVRESGEIVARVMFSNCWLAKIRPGSRIHSDSQRVRSRYRA